MKLKIFRKILQFLWPIIRYYRHVRKPLMMNLYEFRIYKTYAKTNYKIHSHKSITIIIDDNFSQSGFLDKLKGIISGAWLAEKLNIKFNVFISDSKSSLSSIFRNDKKHLILNNYQYLFNQNISRPIVIYNFTPRNLKSVKKRFKYNYNFNLYCNENLLSLFYDNELEMKFKWSNLYYSLFDFEYLNLNIKNKLFINKKHVGIHFRFMNLLGDFKDVRINELSDIKKDEIIDLSMSKLNSLITKHNDINSFFIKSDSIKFLSLVNSLHYYDNRIVIDSENIGHTGLYNDENIFKKAYKDFYDLSTCSIIYQISLQNMRISEFSKYASYINNSTLVTISK
jgi:hypothetical protein